MRGDMATLLAGGLDVTIRAWNDTARHAGACIACNRQVMLDPPGNYGNVQVIEFRPDDRSGTQIRLCSTCRVELRRWLS
jgi:hypothetical protein